MLDDALEYARRGLAVFPCWGVLPSIAGAAYICGCGRHPCANAGKHPMARLAPKGFKNATADENLITHWWQSAPKANIGIAIAMGYAVVDVDPRHGGDATFAKLIEQHGLPRTWVAATGGGGSHYWFSTKTPVRNGAGTIGPGVDVRGPGGYVVAPPSLHISGNRYRWQAPPHESALAPLPAWLMVTAAKAKTPLEPEEICTIIRDGIEDGRRNNRLTQLAGHLLRRDVNGLVVLELMLAVNAAKCRPPLSVDEVTSIVANVFNCETRRRGTEP